MGAPSPMQVISSGWASDPVLPRGQGVPSKGFLCFPLFLPLDITVYEDTGWSSGSHNRTLGQTRLRTNTEAAKRKEDMHLGLPLINAQIALPLDFR